MGQHHLQTKFPHLGEHGSKQGSPIRLELIGIQAARRRSLQESCSERRGNERAGDRRRLVAERGLGEVDDEDQLLGKDALECDSGVPIAQEPADVRCGDFTDLVQDW